jgi:hypothetical protein
MQVWKYLKVKRIDSINDYIRNYYSSPRRSIKTYKQLLVTYFLAHKSVFIYWS